MRTVRQAWDAALYGPQGRYRTGGRDFHTALTDPVTGPVMCAALARLARQVDAMLGCPENFQVVDLGAGTGAFLAWLAADPATPARWQLTGIELAPRPPLAPRIGWAAELRQIPAGFLLAHEWLDDVPCEVLRAGRLLLADGGAGPPPRAVDRDWLDTWWPGWRSEDVECGRARDEAWAGAVARLGAGLALAVDYGHLRSARRSTLTGFHRGRQVPPVYDGSGDITAHVALDALAAAVPGSRLISQRQALRELGVDGRLPVSLTAAGLQAANAAAGLLDRAGYGGFGWVSVARLPADHPGPTPTVWTLGAGG
ncbi:MAG TPA: SAM-dependent methyltransferase [Mycobacteriales bacterium]|jgi:hypothetical protein|nr:SAM-dependent methyltransferase [Mycobacteriales bacterium]